MAIEIKLDCRKAYEKLKGTGYRFHVPMRAVKVYIPNGAHIDAYGRSMSLTRLASILINGNAYIPPRPFGDDAGRVLNDELRQLMIDCSHIKKQNSHNPNYIADVYIDFDTERLCTEATALIKNWLFGGYYCAVVPNAPKTIQHKGFNLPLVETGQLVNSISAKVVFGRGKY